MADDQWRPEEGCRDVRGWSEGAHGCAQACVGPERMVVMFASTDVIVHGADQDPLSLPGPIRISAFPVRQRSGASLLCSWQPKFPDSLRSSDLAWLTAPSHEPRGHADAWFQFATGVWIRGSQCTSTVPHPHPHHCHRQKNDTANNTGPPGKPEQHAQLLDPAQFIASALRIPAP